MPDITQIQVGSTTYDIRDTNSIEDVPDDSEYMRKNDEWTKPLLGHLAFMNSNNGIEIYMVTK